MTRYHWHDLVKPGTVNLILGHKGGGKSALGYSLMQDVGEIHYGLHPIVVDFPRWAHHLLPNYYHICSLQEALTTTNAVILVDEGTTKLPAGDGLEEFVKACSSLSRQRNQIMIFIFHTSRDVGSKALRGMDLIAVKEPSGRQIMFGSKDKWFRCLLEEARERFTALPVSARCRYSFVDSERPEFHGMLINDLPSFWSEELSTAWGQHGVTGDSADEDTPIDQDVIERLIAASEITEGENLVCSMCGNPCTKLMSDVCRSCFVNWVTVVTKKRLQQQKQPNALSNH